jgi:hypothetical protein
VRCLITPAGGMGEASEPACAIGGQWGCVEASEWRLEWILEWERVLVSRWDASRRETMLERISSALE